MKYSTWGTQTLPIFARCAYLLAQAGRSSYWLVMQLGYQTVLSLRRASAKTLVSGQALKECFVSDRPQTSIAPQKYRIGEIVKFMPTGGLGIVTDAKYQPLFYGGEPISPRWMYLVEGVGDRQEWISEYTLNGYQPD
jgi:hypothetical protein